MKRRPVIRGRISDRPPPLQAPNVSTDTLPAVDPAPGALLTVPLITFLPGTLAYLALRPRGRWLECLALAPSLSLAVVFLLGEVTTGTGLSFTPIGFFITVGLLAAAAAQARHRTRSASRAGEPKVAEADTASRYAIGLLATSMLLSTVTWLGGIQGVATTPPNRDSANHGAMAARIARIETMDTDHVLTSDSPTSAQGAAEEAAFYPLGLHGGVALANRVAGVTIADGLLTAMAMFASVVLPLGLFLLVRTLVPENPRLAGLTVLLLAGVSFFPLGPVSFGGIALIAGVAIVPAASVVTAQYLIGGGWADGALAALAAVGIFATHTSEIPLLALVSGSLLLDAALRRRGRRLIVVAAGRALALGVGCTVLLLPVLGSVAGGAAERTDLEEAPIVPFASGLRIFIRIMQLPRRFDMLALLALAGLVLCLWQRRHFAMIFTFVPLFVLYVVASSVEGPLRALTFPWYRQSGRIGLNLVLLLPFFAASALIAAGPRLGKLARRRHSPAKAGIFAITTVAAILAVIGSIDNAANIRRIFDKDVIVDENSLLAFTYLEANVRPGERVLNEVNIDGGLWMYAFRGVRPLFFLNPPRPGSSWQERVWLLTHLPDLGTDPKVAALLDKHEVRLIYLNDRHFVDHPHVLRLEALRATPSLCERFHRGTSHVFEVVPGGACPQRADA